MARAEIAGFSGKKEAHSQLSYGPRGPSLHGRSLLPERWIGVVEPCGLGCAQGYETVTSTDGSSVPVSSPSCATPM